MHFACPGLSLYHDVQESFPDLLRRALHGAPIGVALGPIYEEDPAQAELLPFIRADVETGWSGRPRDPDGLPRQVRKRAFELRKAAIDRWLESYSSDSEEYIDHMDRWARAGLVLEVCRRRGVNVKGLGKAHVNWRLKGTQTGRFGASYWGSSPAWPIGFNPLTIPEHSRSLIVPSAGGRLVCVLDFKAMDLCSMVSLVPGLRERYADAYDMHLRTAELLLGEEAAQHHEARDLCKIEVFVHAYGGESQLRARFEEKIPELTPVRRSKEGEFARMVQAQSARAFRSGLSRALPLLLGDDVIPMFTVHDELVLDISEGSISEALDVSNAMEDGAEEAIETPYFVSTHLGLDYAKAKEDR